MRRPPTSYFVCDSEPVVPVVPDSDAPGSEDFAFEELLFFAAFFDDFALCFAPVVEPAVSLFALEPVADDSEPEEPLPPIESDEPLEPIDPDEPLALEDFFEDAAFLWCFACFAFALPLVPVSLPCIPDEELPCMPVAEPWFSCVAELCASAAPASITAAAIAIHFMSNIRSSARLLLDRDAELRPARNTAGPRNDGFAPMARQGIAPCP